MGLFVVLVELFVVLVGLFVVLVGLFAVLVELFVVVGLFAEFALLRTDPLATFLLFYYKFVDEYII